MADDPILAELERRHAERADSDDRRQMAFALAKAMEDIRADDRLFVYLNKANALTAKRFPYGRDADVMAAGEARKAYTPALVKRWAGKRARDLTPIFVTGLPRSGTPLVEQIIASHPEVAAGGEIGILMRPLTEAVARVAAEGEDRGEEFAGVGRAYLDEAGRLAKGERYVTDETTNTYVRIGHVPLALPEAKIILVRRDPRDSWFSMPKQRFKDGMHRYCYSMEWTAQFYRLFAAQVAFWRKAAAEAFIEVRYEDVVADLEGQARRRIDYGGLH